ncbi:hypothetical protein Bca101_002919 [Brassica carinata]
MSKQWRETDQAVESDRSSGGVRWIAGGGTSGVDLMEQVTERARWKSLEQTAESVNRLSDRVPAFEVSVNGGVKVSGIKPNSRAEFTKILYEFKLWLSSLTEDKRHAATVFLYYKKTK